MNQNKEYFAFISYQRQDEEWAKWLSDQLEHYHLPLTLNGRDDLPKDLRPIFRDIDELSAGNLPHQIYQALNNSKNLIVVCSPNSAKSPWVNKEVETFIGMGKLDRIFPFIIDGIPYAKNKDEECLPEALRKLTDDKERLGANVKEYKDGPQRLCKDCPLPKDNRNDKKQGDINDKGRDAAVVKTVAGMLDLDFDTLWRRYEREKAEEERKIKEQRDNLLRVQSHFLAEKAQMLINQGDSYKAILLSLESLPIDFKHPDKPYVAEAEASLRSAVLHYSEDDLSHFNYKSLALFEGSQCNAAFSPDGNCLASITKENVLKIWEVSTGRLLKAIENLCINYINTLCFSPNGDYIALTGSGEFSLYNTIDYSLIKRGLEANYRTIAFHPTDKKMLVTRFEDSIYGKVCSIKVYDYEDNCFLSIQTDTHNIFSALYSSNGKIFISASKDGVINVWDAEKGNLIETISNETPIISAFFTPDSKQIVSVDMKDIKFWKIGDNRVSRVFSAGEESNFVSAVLSQDGTLLFAALDNNKINIWDAFDNNRLLGCIESNFESITSVVISPSGKHIATTSKENIIRLWEIKEKGNEIKQQIDHYMKNPPLTYFVNNSTIISISNEYAILIWEGGQLAKRIVTDHYSDICAIVYNEQEKCIILADEDFIKKWNLETGSIIDSIELENDYDIKENATFSYDGSKIMAYYSYGEFTIWDTNTRTRPTFLKTISEYCGIWGSVTQASLSPDNKLFVVGYSSGRVDIRDAKTGIINKVLQRGDTLNNCGSICSAYFSNNGNLVVWATEFGIIKIGDVKTGEILHALEHGIPFNSCNSSAIFSPGDKWVVSSSDYLLKIWDVNSGVLLNSLPCNIGKLFPGSISQDCSKIAFSDSDGQIEIISITSCQELCDMMRERFVDYSFTKDDRKKYHLF